MMMPGREYQAQPSRFGFNGKENDNEVKGFGSQYDYGFRIYDPQNGRFLSTDPLFKSYPYYTPYQFAGNTPIWAVDLDGLEEAKSTSAAINAGVQQYVDEKRDQAKSAGNIFTSWKPWRNAWNYATDWGKAVTGDREAVRRVNRKTTDAITKGSMALANGITDPAVFFSTMHTRSRNENIQGGTYYGLKATEFYLSWRFFEAMEEPGPGVNSRGRIGAEEILPNGQRGVWVEEITAGRSANAIDYQSKVTGLKPGIAFKVNNVRFDDFVNAKLIDAKSSYGNLINKKTGEFYDWFKKQGGQEMLNDAQRQIKAANGTPIDWKFEDQGTLNATKSWLESQGIIKGINYIYEPAKK